MQYISDNEEERFNQIDYLQFDKCEDKKMVLHTHKDKEKDKHNDGYTAKEQFFESNKFLKKEKSQHFLKGDKNKNSFVTKPKSKSQRNTVNDNNSKNKTLTRDISQNELPFYNNIHIKQNTEKEKEKDKISYKIKKDQQNKPQHTNNQTAIMIQANPPTNFLPYSSHRIAPTEPMFHHMHSPSPTNVQNNGFPYNPIPINAYSIASPVNSHLHYPNVYAGPTSHQDISNYPSTIHSHHSSSALGSHQSSAPLYGLNHSSQPILNSNAVMTNFFPFTSTANNFMPTPKQPFITYQEGNTLQSTFNITQSNGHGYGFDSNSNNLSRRNMSHISEDLLYVVNANNLSTNTSQLNMTGGGVHLNNKIIQQNNRLQRRKFNSNSQKDKSQVNVLLTNILSDNSYKRNKSQKTISYKNIPEKSEISSLAKVVTQIPNQNILKGFDNVDQFAVNEGCKYELNIFPKVNQNKIKKGKNQDKITQENNYHNEKYGLLLDNHTKNTSISTKKSNRNKLIKSEKVKEKILNKNFLISNDNLSTNTNINSYNNASFQYKSLLNTNSIYKEEPSGCQSLVKFESFNSQKHSNVISTKDSSHLEIQALGIQVPSSKESYDTSESTNKQSMIANTLLSLKEDPNFGNTQNLSEIIGEFSKTKTENSQITNEAKMSNYNSTSDSNPQNESITLFSKKPEKMEMIFNEPKIKNRKFNSDSLNNKIIRKFDSNRTSFSSKTVRVSVLINEINSTNLESDHKIANPINFEGI